MNRRPQTTAGTLVSALVAFGWAMEEELRKLGYVKPNEVIILRRDEPPAKTPG